jgi:two-component sensor histidine kinase
MLGILGTVLYKRYRDKSKNMDLLLLKNNQIEEQQLVIQEALNQKETLLKEIHHRVKNNLQIITSLLNLQSKKITDENVLASINEGKNRVEAMSLIHQNLYQSENLTSINMRNYFQQLATHLSTSFSQPNRRIGYKILVDNVLFDIDTAIPVGLIVNELVSNSYKHAFENRTVGNISIGLKQSDDENYNLVVEDDGTGINLDKSTNSSLGLKLVNSLGTKQLKGDIDISNDRGTKVSITFKEINKTA